MSDVSSPIHVSLAADGGFVGPLAVTLLSLAEAQAQGASCEASIMFSGIDLADRERVESDLAGRIEVEWIEVDMERLSGATVPGGLSVGTMFRLLMPDLVPLTRTRTIYLDADTLVVAPLDALWGVDLNSNVVGAVRDGGSPFAAGTNWQEIELDPSLDYFNAGVLVIPLDRWRSERLGNKSLELLRAHRMNFVDQDALNFLAEGRWLELSRRWNLQTADLSMTSTSWALWREDVDLAINQPGIIHFTRDKPWDSRSTHPYAGQWRDTLARSSVSDWRAGGAFTTRPRRRFIHTAHVLRHGYLPEA